VSDTVKLLFGVHAHQPAGNFASVVREAHERCYRPFIDVVERYPRFPFALHVSGWLLEFLARESPDDVARLRAMVKRGQIEMFGGGDTEPVLAAIPQADRREQLEALSARVQRRLGVRPHGAWLTERVWESTVVPALADRGMRYVVVDDYHFLCAGTQPDRLAGYHATEENGRTLDVFPISEALRYRFPFAPVEEAVGYLERLAPGGAAIYFDDIEKFGIWPQTHDWVYGQRWLERFIEAVVASPRIELLRYADFHAAHKPLGIVYLPTVSYIEMSEWTLPPHEAERFEQLVARARAEGSFDRDKIFLRGGQWKNFFTRYPESNWMHKRMLHASRRFHALSSDEQKPRLRSFLHLAQANDAYWHGLFGGIYLPHLRRQIFAALARLESGLDARHRPPPIERIDFEHDGDPVIVLRDRATFAAVKTGFGASVRELTSLRLAHNFADTLARREERYYRTIRDKVRSGAFAGAGIASIHDRVAYKTEIAESDLEIDRHPRTMFVDRWRTEGGVDELLGYGDAAIDDPSVRFASANAGVSVKKAYRLRPSALEVSYDIDPAAAGVFSTELNIAMPSCDGPGGSCWIDGRRRAGFGESLRADGCSTIKLADTELGGYAEIALDPAGSVDMRPLFTVSQSEAGFEKIMQAVCLVVAWQVDGRRRVRVRFVARREHAA